MVMNTVIARCAEKSPVTVMARLALQRALEPAWVDELFKREHGTQYQRELLFSTTVELMSLVAVGLRPSVHAAARDCPELSVSVQALYDKIKHTEPSLVRALVTGSAARLGDVLGDELRRRRKAARAQDERAVDPTICAEHDVSGERFDHAARIEPLADRARIARLLPHDRRAARDEPRDRVVEAFPHESLQPLVAAGAFRTERVELAVTEDDA